MKRSVLFAVYFLIISSAWSQGLSLAVIRVDPIGVDAETARLVEELLNTEFARAPIFQLVERSRLETLLKEQELQLSGITNAESAAKAGNVLNVQKVVFGSIGKYDSDYVKYVLSLRMVDVERAAVEAAESIQIKSKEDIIPAIAEIVQRLNAKIVIVGYITRVEEATVYTSIGAGTGIGPNENLAVVQVSQIEDESGRVIMREEKPAANLIVESVSAEGSRCRVLEKAVALESGMTVRRGKIVIPETESECGLSVSSVPEEAKVFLNGEFVGVTPFVVSGLEPGKYRMEVRHSAAYKPYVADINLRAGHTVTVSRELEREVDIEEVILLGKIPRRHTDPGTALTLAFVPGLGANYNGYAAQTAVIPLSMFFGGLAGINWVMNVFHDNDALRILDPLTLSPYDYSYSQLHLTTNATADAIGAGIFIGAGILTYAMSLLDAWTGATEDFIYPTFLEVSLGGAGAYTRVVQTQDTQATGIDPAVMAQLTSGVFGFDYAGFAEIVYEARRNIFNLGLEVGWPFFVIKIGFQTRILMLDWLLIGVGMSSFSNIGSPSLDVNALKPQAPNMIAPVASCSFRFPSFEADFLAAPYVIANPFVFKFENTDVKFFGSTMQTLGIWGQLDMRYFFNTRFGIRVSADYAHLWNLDATLRNAGFSALDTLQFGELRAGIVLRY